MADQRVTAVFSVVAERAMKALKRLGDRAEKTEKTLDNIDKVLERIDKTSKRMSEKSALPKEMEKNYKAFEKFTKGANLASNALDALHGHQAIMTSDMRKANTQLDKAGRSMNSLSKSAYDQRTQLLQAADAVKRLGSNFSMAEKDARGLAGGLKFLRDENQKSRKSIDSQGTSFQRFARHISHANDNASDFGRSVRGVMDFSFFRTGIEIGMKFWQVQTMMAAILPVVSVGLGGVGVMVNGLVAGFGMLASSAGRAVGVLAAIPGIIGAMAVAGFGIKGLMSTIFSPAMKGQGQLNQLAMQIQGAKVQVAAAKSTEERTIAQNNLNLLTKEYNNTLARTPKNAAQLTTEVENLKNTWSSVWQGRGRGDLAINQAVKVMQKLQVFIKGIEPGITKVFQVLHFIAGEMGNAFASKGVQNFFNVALEKGAQNLERFWVLAKNLAPIMGGMFNASQDFTGRLADTAIKWSEGLDKNDIINRFTKFLERSERSFYRWLRVIRNVGSGIGNIFKAAAPTTEKFETSLVGISQRFKEWTMVAQPRISAFFENSFPVLKAIGRLVVSIATAFGVLAGTNAGTGSLNTAKSRSDSVVAFLDQLGRGIVNFADFAGRSLDEVGPKMEEFWKVAGKALSGVAPAAIETAKTAMEALTVVMKGMSVLLDFPGARTVLQATLMARMVTIIAGMAVGNAVATLARVAGVAKTFLSLGLVGGIKDLFSSTPPAVVAINNLSAAIKRLTFAANTGIVGGPGVGPGGRGKPHGVPAQRGRFGRQVPHGPMTQKDAKWNKKINNLPGRRMGKIGRGNVVLMLIAGAMTAWDAKQISQMEDIPKVEKQKAIGGSAGFAGGGILGGMAAGAAGGAIGGSVVPVAGTAIGAIVGMIVGGIAGSSLGQKIGEVIGPPLADAWGKYKAWAIDINKVVISFAQGMGDSIRKNLGPPIENFKNTYLVPFSNWMNENLIEPWKIGWAELTGMWTEGWDQLFGPNSTWRAGADQLISDLSAFLNKITNPFGGKTDKEKNENARSSGEAFGDKLLSFIGVAARASVGGGAAFLARGGIVPGSTSAPTRDSVHTMLTPGEVVLNESQQNTVGKSRIGMALAGKTGAMNPPGAGSSRSNTADYAEGGEVASSNPFKQIEGMFGLSRSSGDNDAPGSHADGSYHYRPASWGGVQAYDYGDASNSQSALSGAALYAQANAGHFAEEFFDKLPQYVKNGSVVSGQIGGHLDHLHLAMSGGGALPGAGAGGGGALGGAGAAPPQKMGKIKIQLPASDKSEPLAGNSLTAATDIIGRVQKQVDQLITTGNEGLQGMPGTPSGIAGTWSGGAVPADNPAAAKSYARWAMGGQGWGPDQFAPLDSLWTRESNWMSSAMNASSGAYGIPQCVSVISTKILTKRGYLSHDEVEIGDETIGFNPETGKNEWTTVTGVLHPGEAELWEFGVYNWKGTSTLNHRWLMDRMVEDKPTDREMVELQNNEGRKHRVVLSAPSDINEGEGLDITVEEAALLGWLAADGWQEKPKKTLRNTPDRGRIHSHRPTTYFISQSKQEHWWYIEQSLGEQLREDGTKRWSTRTRPRGKEGRLEREWKLSSPYARELEKRSGGCPKTDSFAMVLKMSPEQRAAWLESMLRAEGYVGPGYTQITQNEGDTAEAVKLAIYLTGKIASVYRDEQQVDNHDCESDTVCLTMGIKEPYVGLRNATFEHVSTEEVWCVTTELGTWTAQQGENVFLTGNSLPASKMGNASQGGGPDYLTNPATQMNWGFNYIKGRYQSPAGAWAASEQKGWYGTGGEFTASGPQVIGVGEKGPERVSIQPISGAGSNVPRRAGDSASGGGPVNITSTINVGMLIGDESGLAELTGMVGDRIYKDLKSARGNAVRKVNI